MKTTITHVAMDTHKRQHQVAWVHPDTGEIQEFTVLNRTREIDRMVKKIRQQAPGEIHVCHEAGLCGFVLKRRPEALGCVCQVIAPSRVWRKPGDRVKMNRRDAKKLLCQFVAGQLTEVFEFSRFDSPGALMAYLGVTPSEDSSGESAGPGRSPRRAIAGCVGSRRRRAGTTVIPMP